MNPLRVFIGYDGRETEAYRVAESSLRRHASVPVDVTPLNAETLAAYGLLRRPQDRRGYTYDIHSNAPQSTEFAISRFLVPHLAQTGWALFVDADVVFLADVADLFDQADPDKAVMVVKHQQPESGGTKMDGQAQLAYRRKNWSSVCLWNVNHPANRRLSLQDVNERPGRDLHAFYWLHDDEIGNLSCDWNWLVGVQEKPLFPKIAHFTLGTPNLAPDLADCQHAEIWWEASR
jgi:lipopolysaccharide biosynthesis glycosyltransferase